MFILITDVNGNDFTIKKSAIRRVYKSFPKGKTIVSISTKHVAPITVDGSVKDFYNKLTK